MELELAFVGGILLVGLLGFIAYKVKEAKSKPSVRGPQGSSDRNTKVN